MLMYSEKRRPREGRAPCLGEPHRARTAFGLRKARAYPGTAPSDSAAPELRKLLSSSCPRAAPHPSPLLGAAFHQPRAPIGALHQAPQPSQRHVTSLPRSLLQLGAASAGFLEGRGGRKWQRRRAEVGGRVRTRVVRRCRSHGGARRAAAGGPRAGAGAAGAGRPLHARGDQVGRPPGPVGAALCWGSGADGPVSSFVQGCPEEGHGSRIQNTEESPSEGGFYQLYSGRLCWLAVL